MIVLEVRLAVDAGGGTRALDGEGGTVEEGRDGRDWLCLGLPVQEAVTSTLVGLLTAPVGHSGGRQPLIAGHLGGGSPVTGP